MNDLQSNGESSNADSVTVDGTTTALTIEEQCASCNKVSETPLKECNKCHSVQYCSRDCQKADLKKHKKVCAAAAQVYAQTAEFKPAAPRAPPKEGHRAGLRKWQFDT